MKVIVHCEGVFQENCYIVFDETTKEGIIVDPGEDAEGIINICTENALDIKYIILTHGHGDHIGAVCDTKSYTGAKVIMDKKDEYLIKGGNDKLTPLFKKIKQFNIDYYVSDKEIINLKGFSLEIISTPGHTPGGICVRIGDILLSGDTLFKGTIGRTDFEFGSQENLIYSIHTRLLILPEETKIYPGHGSPTTIEMERKFNPFC